MTCCRLRYCLISLCVFQLVLSVERLIFDFLAYLWLPIFMTFVELVVLIFALFGAFQLRLSYLVLFCSWSVIWLIWNVFLICFFLGARSFDKAEGLLSLYTGGTSFWHTGGLGCQPVYLNNGSAPVPRDPYQRPGPDRVDGCWVPYQHVEAAHSGAQLVLTVLAGCVTLAVLIRHHRQHSTEKVKSRSLSPSFHIEYRTHRAASPDSGPEGAGAALPAPMTPRKIKRRSMSRSSHRSSGRSSRSASHRASQRSRRHANPVAQLMDSSSSEAPLATLSGRVNPSFQNTEWAPPRPPSVHSSYSNYHGQRQLMVPGYGTSGTLTAGRRLGGVGPPPYSSTPSLNETAM